MLIKSLLVLGVLAAAVFVVSGINKPEVAKQVASQPVTQNVNQGNVEGVKTGTGFDQYGYNDTARLFNGTGSSWCLAKSLSADCLGIYSPDKLVMKWNAEWDRGNFDGWSNPPYKAWTDNEWNGKAAGGSGAVWHYKIVWVGDYTANPSLIPDGGYGIWGQFATIMDQGQDPNIGPGHLWYAKATPAGYGAYPKP